MPEPRVLTRQFESGGLACCLERSTKPYGWTGKQQRDACSAHLPGALLVPPECIKHHGCTAIEALPRQTMRNTYRRMSASGCDCGRLPPG